MMQVQAFLTLDRLPTTGDFDTPLSYALAGTHLRGPDLLIPEERVSFLTTSALYQRCP